MPTDIAWRRLFGGRSGDEPALRAQIGRMVSEAIAAGLLVPGARLPSSRGLAAELGLARNTVVAAYDALIEPGDIFFMDPEQGRRFFRLGFTAIPLQQIEPGLRRLAAVLAACSR